MPIVAARKQTMLARRPANLQNLDDGHDWCDNTNYSYRDITGDDCSWYDSFPDTCGNYDYNGFEANSMCCSCGGGYNQVCEDTSLGFTDAYGDGCDWYASNPGYCGDFDDSNFSASSMCCTCNGGTGPWLVFAQAPTPVSLAISAKVTPILAARKQFMLASIPLNLADLSDGHTWCDNTNYFFRDITGDDCSWYDSYPSTCGQYDTWDFWAVGMCCSCGGGYDNVCEDSSLDFTDSFGDNCDWYAENPGYCGDYDDANFSASSMCCSCSGGGPALNLQATSQPLNLNKVTPVLAARKQTMLARSPVNLHNLEDGYGMCDNTNYYFRDITGDDCSWYDSFPSTCGDYDYNGFEANSQCCACGGGHCEDGAHGATDTYGDDCSWYNNFVSLCGDFDDADFSANSMCCACSGGLLNLAEHHAPQMLSTDKVAPIVLARKASMLASAPLNLQNLDDGHDWCDNTNYSYRDITGDDCSWYDSFPDTCGNYDYNGFEANSMCCSCGGGYNQVCEDTSLGFTDAWGDNCDWYASNPGFCGEYDDADFSANSDCCTCNGGTGPWNLQAQTPQPLTLIANKVLPVVLARKAVINASTPAVLQDLSVFCDNTAYGLTDITGDGCEWYDSFPDTCGEFDYGSFVAENHCCVCGGGYWWSGTHDWNSDMELSAKNVSESKESSNSEIIMYAGCAIASLAVFAWNMQSKKNHVVINEHDVFERLI